MSAVSRRRLDRGQRERQPGARDDRVGAGVDGAAHRGFVVALQGDHDVDAGVAAAGLGRRDFTPHGLGSVDLAARGARPTMRSRQALESSPRPPATATAPASGYRETPTPMPPCTIGRGMRMPLMVSEGSGGIAIKEVTSSEQCTRPALAWLRRSPV